MIVVCSLIVVAGQLLFTAGIAWRTYWLMGIGRALFGVTGESLEVMQALVVTEYFRGHLLGFALGVTLTAARLAAVLNDIVSPRVATTRGPVFSGAVGAIVCIIAAACGILLAAVYRPLGQASELTPRSETSISAGKTASDERYGQDSLAGLVDGCSRASTRNRAGDTDSARRTSGDDGYDNAETRTTASPRSSALEGDDESTPLLMRRSSDVTATVSSSTQGWREIARLPGRFWVFCVLIIVLYGAVNPMVHVLSGMLAPTIILGYNNTWTHLTRPFQHLTDILQAKYGESAESAGVFMAVPDMVSALGSPICGLVIDRVVQRRGDMARRWFLPISALLLVVAHCVLAFTAIHPLCPLVILGMAYALFGGALWPLVPSMVHDERCMGTAYGLATVALNMGLCAFPLVVAALMTTWSIFVAQLWFVGLSLAGVAVAVWIALAQM